MAPDLPKKIIEIDSEAAEDFQSEEPVSASSRGEEGRAGKGSGKTEPLPDGDDEEATRQGFSLDAFEISANKDSGFPTGERTEGVSSELDTTPSFEPEDDEETPEENKTKRFPNKRVLVAASCVFCFALAGFAAWQWLKGSEKPPQIVTAIRKPIPIPDIREKVDFILLVNTQNEKELLSMSLELEFHNPDKYRKFQEENIMFRDVIYSFLQNQRPARNSLKDWQKTVQDGLLPHLKDTLPQSRADMVRLSRVETL